MKAVRVNEWGQPVQLEDIPQPEPGSDEVLVRVKAASINPFDLWIHAGYMQAYLSPPLTLGTDFAGEVVKVGSEIKHVKPGDAVYGLVPMHSGSFAEYVVAKAHEVTNKPRSLSYAEAAGAPLATLAGYQSLFDLGQAQQGERILILGAGGAVGGAVVQMAKRLGAYVYAVDVAEKALHIQALGAACFIDAQAERYEEVAGTVDLVLDFVGGDNLQRSLGLLQSGGRYVTSLILPGPQDEAEKRGVRVAALATQARVDHLDDVARQIDSGELKIFINSTYPLARTQEALEYRMRLAEVGKVVLTV